MRRRFPIPANWVIRPILVVLLVVAVSRGKLRAWQPGESTRPLVATITFTLASQKGNPSYYELSINSMGSASYKSLPDSDQRTGAPYLVEFPIASTTRARIFRLAQQSDFFAGPHRIARAGGGGRSWKSLTFADGSVAHRIAYTSSKDKGIHQLTGIFEDISATLEYGRRLQRFHTTSAKRLQAELKRLEKRVARRKVMEFGVIAPVVQRIAADAAVSVTSRRLAQVILEMTQASA